jgi:hypothetical protein
MLTEGRLYENINPVVFRNHLTEQCAMCMDREQETFVSRRSLLTAASTTLTGAALAATPLPALADLSPDAELLRLDLAHDAAFRRLALSWTRTTMS